MDDVTEALPEGMSIGEAASRSGVPAKTIRYYEEIGLIAPALRQANGYRAYGRAAVHVLRFLRRARDLGFSVEACRTLLSLWRDRDRQSADVKRLASAQVAEIDRRVAALLAMRGALATLMVRCHGDDRPDCPILADLERGAGAEREAQLTSSTGVSR